MIEFWMTGVEMAFPGETGKEVHRPGAPVMMMPPVGVPVAPLFFR
jgi:hypothetical protein